MADYNIYIHAVGTGVASTSSPTTPWSQRGEGGAGGAESQTSVKGSDSITGAGTNAALAVTRAASFMQNPDSLISSAVSSIGKAFPIAAAAYACVKLGEAIIDNVIDFSVIESGDYRTQIGWENLRRGLQVVLHPISSSIQMFKTERQWARQNERQKAQLELLGDSVANTYHGRGV